MQYFLWNFKMFFPYICIFICTQISSGYVWSTTSSQCLSCLEWITCFSVLLLVSFCITKEKLGVGYLSLFVYFSDSFSFWVFSFILFLLCQFKGGFLLTSSYILRVCHFCIWISKLNFFMCIVSSPRPFVVVWPHKTCRWI